MCYPLRNVCLALVILCWRLFFFSFLYAFVDSKQVCDGRLVAVFVIVYLVSSLHNVVIEVVDSSLCSSCGSCECALDHLRLLHVLLRNLV
jgi:hypothetical protein